MKQKIDKKTKTITTNKKKLSKSAIALIVGLSLLLIPAMVFGGILLSAHIANKNPVVGSRFAGDLDPQITKEQLKEIKDKISKNDKVDKCEALLTTSQVRINIDTKDNLTKEEMEELVKSFYNDINTVLAIKDYFTADNEKKMYDLSIDIYNFIDADNDKMIHYILTKNSQMKDFTLQLVSEALDEELAKEVRGENIETEIMGGENIEIDPDDIETNETNETDDND